MAIDENESSSQGVAASGTMTLTAGADVHRRGNAHHQPSSSDGQLQQTQKTIETMEEGSGLLHRDNDKESSTTNKGTADVVPTEVFKLPESTYTLLMTEDVFSKPSRFHTPYDLMAVHCKSKTGPLHGNLSQY